MNDKHRFTLWLPKELWKRLVILAKRHRRSATQEILVAIERHLESCKETPNAHNY